MRYLVAQVAREEEPHALLDFLPLEVANQLIVSLDRHGETSDLVEGTRVETRMQRDLQQVRQVKQPLVRLDDAHHSHVALFGWHVGG